MGLLRVGKDSIGAWGLSLGLELRLCLKLDRVEEEEEGQQTLAASESSGGGTCIDKRLEFFRSTWFGFFSLITFFSFFLSLFFFL